MFPINQTIYLLVAVTIKTCLQFWRELHILVIRKVNIDDLEIEFMNWRVLYQDESLRYGVDALTHSATVRDDYKLLYRLYSILVQ